MNKLVLEKLLHLYKLVPEKTNVDLEINYDDEGNKSWNQTDDKWLNFVNATLLPEWKTKKVTMEKQRTKTYLKKVSDQIQQSGKFFADLSYLTATITAMGALMYNTNQANKSVAVLDFVSNKTSTSGTFTIQFPNFTDTLAIIRLA